LNGKECESCEMYGDRYSPDAYKRCHEIRTILREVPLVVDRCWRPVGTILVFDEEETPVASGEGCSE
jgi:hypothetical protein